jgi:hypothetical protein
MVFFRGGQWHDFWFTLALPDLQKERLDPSRIPPFQTRPDLLHKL